MSAQALLAEREANATRFDATFKGKWVTVSGQIEKIDGGKVYLRGDGFLSDVVLEDLSADKQIPLNVGEEFSATCKVGNYILGTIFLNSCQQVDRPLNRRHPTEHGTDPPARLNWPLRPYPNKHPAPPVRGASFSHYLPTDTGEPDAVKAARPVRKGADGKVLR